MLVWDQRVAHGTAPNASPRCRMAQYLKAFLRSTSFPSTHCAGGEKVGDTAGPGGEKEKEKQVSRRLLRRSRALDYILRQNGARDVVSPLGETLFALDVL